IAVAGGDCFDVAVGDAVRAGLSEVVEIGRAPDAHARVVAGDVELGDEAVHVADVAARVELRVPRRAAGDGDIHSADPIRVVETHDFEVGEIEAVVDGSDRLDARGGCVESDVVEAGADALRGGGVGEIEAVDAVDGGLVFVEAAPDPGADLGDAVEVILGGQRLDTGDVDHRAGTRVVQVDRAVARHRLVLVDHVDEVAIREDVHGVVADAADHPQVVGEGTDGPNGTQRNGEDGTALLQDVRAAAARRRRDFLRR